MLTLQHNGKNYKWADKSTEIDGAWLGDDTLKELIRVGLLEETKEVEKREPQTFVIGFDEYDKIKKKELILERIKEWIKEKERLYGDADISGTYPDGAMTILEGLQDLIDEQEEKEKPEAIKAAEKHLKDNDFIIAGVDLKFNKYFQPEPGELIEVSQDEEIWNEARFHRIDGERYVCLYEECMLSWKYARPLTNRELPEVPDWDGEPAKGLMEADLNFYKQVHALTLFCQHLRKKLSRNK